MEGETQIEMIEEQYTKNRFYQLTEAVSSASPGDSFAVGFEIDGVTLFVKVRKLYGSVIVLVENGDGELITGGEYDDSQIQPAIADAIGDGVARFLQSIHY